jgi:hypothetical protein
MTQFERDLRALLNTHSAENESNTPDYVLANYIMISLKAFNAAVNAREEYYGRNEKQLS